MFSYWASLENWTRGEWESAADAFDEKYSFLLPYVPYEVHLRLGDLLAVAKSIRPSSPGVDGWTHRELSLLPVEAWHDLMMTCSRNPEMLFLEIDWRLQEGSISKTSDRPPSADEVRPIDVFSAVLRSHATTVVNLVRPWTLQVSHKAQHVLVGGVLHACSNLAWRSAHH